MPCHASKLLTIAAAIAPEALVSRGHEQAHTKVGQHALLHGEALLVLSSHDLENVTLQKGKVLALRIGIALSAGLQTCKHARVFTHASPWRYMLHTLP